MAADGRGWTIFVQEKMTITEFQILDSESFTRWPVAAMRQMSTHRQMRYQS